MIKSQIHFLLPDGENRGLSGAGAGQGKVFTAAILPAVPIVVRVHHLGVNQFTTNADFGGSAAIDYVDGVLCLTQNTAVTLQAVAATTTSNGIISMLWAEIPV